MEPGDGTELLWSREKTRMDEELLLRVEQKVFHELESTLGKDAVKIVEMTTKDLEYHINGVEKVVAGIDSNFERSSPVSKRPSNSIAHYGEIIHEGKT